MSTFIYAKSLPPDPAGVKKKAAGLKLCTLCKTIHLNI